MRYLHSENIIHADLKGLSVTFTLVGVQLRVTSFLQVNILVNNSGRACITDFGISTIWTDRTLGFTHTTGGVIGRSTRWAAPELFEEGQKPSRASDIWAFGAVCYEVRSLLTMRNTE